MISVRLLSQGLLEGLTYSEPIAWLGSSLLFMDSMQLKIDQGKEQHRDFKRCKAPLFWMGFTYFSSQLHVEINFLRRKVLQTDP